MKFLTTFTIIFCGGSVLVGADFWVEFRAQTPQTSSSRRWGFGRSGSSSSAANFMYECKGRPAGTSAFEAEESRCRPVTSYEGRVNIHMTCNFYVVYRPRLHGQTVHFSDHRRAHSEVIWFVGFKNDNIDHPNFFPAAGGDITDFRNKVLQMGFVVPPELVDFLAQYLAETNIIALSGMPDRLIACLNAFKVVLDRIRQWYDYYMHQEDGEQLREGFGEAMKVLLQKMIDPCAVIPDHPQMPLPAEYCTSYCNFLNTAAQHFGGSSARCSALEGGVCISMVCKCFLQVNNPFAGCTTSPMQLCNNELTIRTRLDLFNA